MILDPHQRITVDKCLQHQAFETEQLLNRNRSATRRPKKQLHSAGSAANGDENSQNLATNGNTDERTEPPECCEPSDENHALSPGDECNMMMNYGEDNLRERNNANESHNCLDVVRSVNGVHGEPSSSDFFESSPPSLPLAGSSSPIGFISSVHIREDVIVAIDDRSADTFSRGDVFLSGKRLTPSKLKIVALTSAGSAEPSVDLRESIVTVISSGSLSGNKFMRKKSDDFIIRPVILEAPEVFGHGGSLESGTAPRIDLPQKDDSTGPGAGAARSSTYTVSFAASTSLRHPKFPPNPYSVKASPPMDRKRNKVSAFIDFSKFYSLKSLKLSFQSSILSFW